MKNISNEEANRRYNQVESSQCVVELTKEFRDAATIIAGNGFNTYYRHPEDKNTVVMTINNIGNGSRVFGVILPERIYDVNKNKINVVGTLIKYPWYYRAGKNDCSRASIVCNVKNPFLMGTMQVKIETTIMSYVWYNKMVNIRTGKNANKEIHHKSYIWDNRYLAFLSKEDHHKEPHHSHKCNYLVRPNQLIPVMQTTKK